MLAAWSGSFGIAFSHSILCASSPIKAGLGYDSIRLHPALLTWLQGTYYILVCSILQRFSNGATPWINSLPTEVFIIESRLKLNKKIRCYEANSGSRAMYIIVMAICWPACLSTWPVGRPSCFRLCCPAC